MGVGYACQLLAMGVGLFLTRFPLERLGSKQYGLWLVGLDTALAVAWAPGHLVGFLSVGLAATLYGLVVSPVAFGGPLGSYVRPQGNALSAPLSPSKPSGAV
jgi:hypothetical protein